MVKYECRICRMKLDKKLCLDFGFICNGCDQLIDKIINTLSNHGFVDTDENIANILKNLSVWIRKMRRV